MRSFLSIIVPGFLSLALLSCQSSGTAEGEFRLLPQPQSFEILGNSQLNPGDVKTYSALDGVELPEWVDLAEDIQSVEEQSEAQLIIEIDDALEVEKEGYILDISKKQVSITGKDKAGLMYGLMTLDQLMEDSEEQQVPLPMCSIKDYPLLSYRSIQLDMKHHMEKTGYYYKLMDILASYKVNAIIAEMEDKLGYERQPLVGSEDALSIEEWKKLSDYAMERNIEISPLIQGLGHASFILKHDQYKELRDDPASDWAFNPLDPKTYEVQFDLYLDALEATPHGKYLHVGGDEVHTTGRKSGKSQLELQLSWLDKVCKFAEEHGRTPIFWDDMPIKHAGLYRPMFNTKPTREEIDQLWEENEHKLVEFLDMFPKNCIYMRWNYSSPQAEGNLKAMEWFIENDFQVMGATAGQTRWVLMPQNESNMENIRSFTQASIDKGLDGLLLTLWDDDSPHFELYMRGILSFAEYSWSGDIRSKEDIKAAYRHREFSSAVAGEEYAFIDRLEKPVEFWKNALLQNGDRNRLRRANNPIEDVLLGLPDAHKPGVWSNVNGERISRAKKMLHQCDSVEQVIHTLKGVAIRNQFRLQLYDEVNKLVRFSPELLLALQSYDLAATPEDKEEARTKVHNLAAQFSELRSELEKVYGETRILEKPAGYLLDQDHHVHLANQALSFDWQFMAEMLFLEKLENMF